MLSGIHWATNTVRQDSWHKANPTIALIFRIWLLQTIRRKKIFIKQIWFHQQEGGKLWWNLPPSFSLENTPQTAFILLRVHPKVPAHNASTLYPPWKPHVLPCSQDLCFKVKGFSYIEGYGEQSSSRFISSRRQSSFCRAPWQHGIALFPLVFVEWGVSSCKRQSALPSQAPSQEKMI